MIAATEGSRRWPVTYGKSVMDAVTKGSFSATMVAAFCVAGMAMAETPIKPADIAGRWVSDKVWISASERMTFDISRCGDGWCGVEVKTGSTCGKTMLRLDQGELRERFVKFTGRVETAPGTQPYVIRAHLSRHDGAFQINMFGNTGDELQLWRRSFPFNQLMVRSGDAVCQPDPKVS